MSIHGCNELCNAHPALHDLQRALLPMEGHEENAAELLLEQLRGVEAVLERELNK